ncbi:methyltransferase family protein [Actinomadura verrucosospora]|uniref:Isoprenylcysteine carboxyl methyltransferase n=1 Tax=Actinomadura verrucosospora TaxID=46165 RepID=A0A7D3ZI46_ACTVE|nr:isoprenylcysteine carboxylmethyltransferase family protein [Actinomadura verrucosospora]QKG18663.1 hypothetical protein ACTIVE_0297 [Actinomadura verrucosospora]
MADRRWGHERHRRKAERLLGLLARRAAPPAALALARPAYRRPEVLLPLAVLSAWTVAEVLAEDDEANATAAGGADDAGTRYALVGAHMLAWWVPFLVAPRGNRPGRQARLVAGAAMVAAGGGLRVAAIRTLGGRFTGHVRVLPEQQVCASGPYAWVRHPSYVGLLGINAGPAVSAGSPAAAAAMLVATALGNVLRVRVEERLLHERLGAPYARYAAATPRFVPLPGRAARARQAAGVAA